MNTEASSFTQNLINQRINAVIRAQPNTDLALKILCSIRSTGSYVDLLPKSLGISASEVEAILDSFMIEDFIHYGSRTKKDIERDEMYAERGESRLLDVYVSDEVKSFLKSETPFGPFILLEKSVSPDEACQVMTAIEDMVVFYYTRTEDVSAERLKTMKQVIDDAVNELCVKEKEILQKEVLCLKKNERITSSISFISAKNPLHVDGYDNHSLPVIISVDYKSPAEAIDDGIMKINMILKSDVLVKHNSEETRFIPSEMHLQKQDAGYELYIGNALYLAVWNEYDPFSLLQEARKKTELMVERLKPIIPEIKAPTKYTKD